MKKIIRFLPLLLIFTLSACTLHMPYDFDSDYRDYRIVFKVDPDDADILLNGRFVGEAYEFSTSESAMRLTSRKNEIVIKKRGYVEEVIDLYKFNSRRITIRVRLLQESRDPKRAYKPRAPRPEKPTERPEVVAKTAPVKKPPKEIEEEPMTRGEAINVVLSIKPVESSIYLNGKFWGISPEDGKIENFKLTPGKYTLEIVKPGYKTYVKKLVIKDQKDLKLFINLEKR
jgi:hypothetical protein